MLYSAVIEAVLLLGSDSWALSYTMIQVMEGTHVGFLKVYYQ